MGRKEGKRGENMENAKKIRRTRRKEDERGEKKENTEKIRRKGRK